MDGVADVGGGSTPALGPETPADDEHCVVVEPNDESGIVLNQDGSASVALPPRRPPRPDEFGAGDEVDPYDRAWSSG